MKLSTLFTLLLCFAIAPAVYSQTCNDCTLTLSTTQSTPIYVNANEKLCITSTGSLNSTLYVMGGEVCNNGVINGIIDMTDGIFTNYGEVLSGMNISVDKGVFINQNIIQAAQLSFNGNSLTVENHGGITANNFQMIQQGSGSMVSMTNNGSLGIASYQADSTLFTNNGSLTTTGQFSNNNGASFINNGSLDVGANFTNQAYFYTSCMIPVGGLWANNSPGVIEGPMSGCGGFSANLSTSNFSDFGMDGSNLDMCDSSNPGSFNFNPGNIGPQVTFCACQTNCFQTVATEKMVAQNPILVYPNPTSNFIQISAPSRFQHITLRDITGKIVFSKSESSTLSSINLSGIAPGMYFLQADQTFFSVLVN